MMVVVLLWCGGSLTSIDGGGVVVVGVMVWKWS